MLNVIIILNTFFFVVIFSTIIIAYKKAIKLINFNVKLSDEVVEEQQESLANILLLLKKIYDKVLDTEHAVSSLKLNVRNAANQIKNSPDAKQAKIQFIQQMLEQGYRFNDVIEKCHLSNEDLQVLKMQYPELLNYESFSR